MKLPPNSLYLGRARSGQFIVWMTRSSGFGHLPDLLDADLPAHRVTGEVEVVDGGLRQVADRPLGEHGGLGHQVGPGLEVAELLAVAAAALVAGADALDDPVLDQQLVGHGLGEDVGARLLGLLGEEARQLRDRGDVVAVVPEVGRRRLQRDRPLLGQQIDGVLLDLLVDRPIARVEVGEQLLHRRRHHVRPGDVVGAAGLALLDHRDRDLAELLGQLRLVLEQLHDAVGAGEPGRPAADDDDAGLEALLRRIGRRTDVVRRIERRRELARLRLVLRHLRTR